MCRSQYPPNFLGKKNGKDDNSVSCTKNSLVLVSRKNVNISRGCGTKMEFPEGRGGPFCELILENPEGRGGHRQNPFRGWGMDILELHDDIIKRKTSVLFPLPDRKGIPGAGLNIINFCATKLLESI